MTGHLANVAVSGPISQCQVGCCGYFLVPVYQSQRDSELSYPTNIYHSSEKSTVGCLPLPRPQDSLPYTQSSLLELYPLSRSVASAPGVNVTMPIWDQHIWSGFVNTSGKLGTNKYHHLEYVNWAEKATAIPTWYNMRASIE